MASPAAGPTQARRARQTGTVVEVWRADAIGLDDEGGRWFTVCTEHATSIAHATRRLAEWHAVDPRGWCEDCRPAADPDQVTA